MPSLSSPLNPLDPVPERWLAGAVVELSAYDDALSEFERTAIFDFEKSGEED